ncbi:MAG: hypothetical protein R3E31_03475 [Chloroflexota bacterium]
MCNAQALGVVGRDFAAVGRRLPDHSRRRCQRQLCPLPTLTAAATVTLAAAPDTPAVPDTPTPPPDSGWQTQRPGLNCARSACLTKTAVFRKPSPCSALTPLCTNSTSPITPACRNL